MLRREPFLFGRHIARSTPWHSVDPRVRLLLSLAASGIALASRSPAEIALVYGCVLLLYIVSRTGRRTAWSGFRPFLVLLLFTSVIQLLFTPGEMFSQPVLSALPLTHEGVRLAALILLRLSAVILVSTHLIATTSPLELSRSLGWTMQPLARFGLPVADVVMVLNLGFQFFPIILEEGQSLRLALESRGISLRHSRLTLRLKALTAWLLALLVAVLERSQRIALALEVKNCGRAGSLRLRFPTWGRESTAGLAALAVFTLFWSLV